MQALEREKEDDVPCGEIETAHTGCQAVRIRSMLEASKVSGVFTISLCGHLFQRGYSKALHDEDTDYSCRSTLNDRVLPFFAAQGMGIIRILTDRDTEFCGKVESYDYELYLGVNGIEHTNQGSPTADERYM